MSLLFGFLKYSLKKKTSITAVTNFFKLSNAIVSPIHTYSSIKSPDTPYISILSTAVIICNEDRPSFLALFFFFFWDKVRVMSFYLRLNMEKKRTLHPKSPTKLSEWIYWWGSKIIKKKPLMTCQITT